MLAEAAFRLEAPLFAGMDTYAVLAKQAEVGGAPVRQSRQRQRAPAGAGQC